jgi:4-hydroxybenzoate polyprenyltransferase
LKKSVGASTTYTNQGEDLVRYARPTDWLVAMRLHQWVKNTLVFLPLALTPQLLSVQSVVQCVLGFIALGIVCSGSYLINDVLDCAADKQHWSKCKRPVASGLISTSSALWVGVGLCTAGLLFAVAINGLFAGFLAVYIVLSLSYSYYLKTLILLDLIALASMFTLRIMMGAVLIGGAINPWLPVFVFLFFGGLSATKRTTELARRTQRCDHSNNRRGYLETDLTILIPFGISMSMGALIILGVFLTLVAVPEALYRSPLRLWVAVPLLLVWTLRIWTLATRGALPDDPVLFSLRDPLSLCVGVLLGISILAAHLP